MMHLYSCIHNPIFFYCCDCKKLKARVKTPEWWKIPADQKRCGRCSTI